MNTAPLLPLSILCLLAMAVTAAGQTKFALQTAYEVEEVFGAHRIEIGGTITESGGEGKLILDPNTCTINEFGDRTICTQIAPLPQPVKLRELDVDDRREWGRRVFEVTGAEIDGTLLLVLPGAKRMGAPKLVIRKDDKTARVMLLEPLPKRPE